VVHFFDLVVEKEVHPKDMSCGLVGSAGYLHGPLEHQIGRSYEGGGMSTPLPTLPII
jgi:hypothetical protein